MVGFKHPVTDRHASFTSGPRFLAWADLAQTGVAYSAVEQLNAKAVVLIVLGFAPHLEVSNFVSRLLRVDNREHIIICLYNKTNIIQYQCATTCMTKRFNAIIGIFVQHVVSYVYAKPGM